MPAGGWFCSWGVAECEPRSGEQNGNQRAGRHGAPGTALVQPRGWRAGMMHGVCLSDAYV